MVWSWNVVWGLQGPRLGVDGKTKSRIGLGLRLGAPIEKWLERLS